MNYAYDISLGFNEYLVNFFDWSDITYIRKIPIIKVNDQTLKDFINNKIKITSIFKIKNKTVSKLKEHTAIFFNKETALAILFDNYGVSIKKSYLLFQDEKDIIKHNCKLNIEEVSYQIISSEPIINNTKKQIEVTKFLKTKLEETKSNYDKLKYLYYECFNKKEENIDYILRTLEHFLNDESVNLKLYEIFNSKLLIDKNT